MFFLVKSFLHLIHFAEYLRGFQCVNGHDLWFVRKIVIETKYLWGPVWWPRKEQSKPRRELFQLQKLANLYVIGAMKNALNVTLELLLQLQPLGLIIKGGPRTSTAQKIRLNGMEVPEAETTISSAKP